MAILSLFVALQCADFATTLLFLQRGVGDANPLVAALIGVSGHPALTVFLLKAAGCVMAVYAWRSGRIRLLRRRANLFFALCVAWNLLALAGR